ncbi:SER_THR_PHOSPHATASE domain-containing protein [Meloidogyne graminicola]|uniref:Serine/threonine-protein phosphatase n=1 Tax=Meloidogyne graminicola TaxID=189291 RepID=A0A8S9ZKF3_9BILA|nr:SER_THR_PHOSPHATASE domain-containing protein [Meloidogyne graminicola]
MADDNTAATALAASNVDAGESVYAGGRSMNSESVKEEPTFILDKFLEKHLRYTKKRVSFIFDKIVYHPSELTTLCLTAEAAFKKNFKDDSCLVKISQMPIYIVGDLHGEWRDLLRIFNALGMPGDKTYLFLGDYVDRGLRSVEIYLLRGNHETDYTNACYGFREEIKSRFNQGDSDSVYKHFNNLFKCLPLCALVADHILCMHGGLSPLLNKFSDLQKIKIPRDIVAQDCGLDLDLLWSDPKVISAFKGDVEKFEANETRACSYVFGPQDVYATCERLGLKLIVRAHQAFNRGFGFFAGKRLLTVFSATNYATKGSLGAVLHIQLAKAQDKKGRPTGKLEFQAGIILFRPATNETRGKRKFIQEFEEMANPTEEEDEDTKLERIGKMPTEEELRDSMQE